MSCSNEITVGARSSRLSQAQVQEVLLELRQFHPDIEFIPLFALTTGDKNKQICLTLMDKTDFFTKEIDLMVLHHECRVGIHSAKDLPETLADGLEIFAITRGVDSGDALVLREGDSLETLRENSVIGTSSIRRELEIRKLRHDLKAASIRGTIDERLVLLQENQVDGLVMAEAAIIRLQLTHLNRIRLQGETAPLQGKLAIVGRKDDHEMKELFACLDYSNQLCT